MNETENKSKNMIVVGCGRFGAELAYRLFLQKYRVVVVDFRETTFANLHPDFRGRTMVGDALNRGVLERAGIEEAQGLAAVTSSDPTNTIVGHIAKETYHVPHVVSRNFDPRYRTLHEAYGLQMVSSAIWGAQRIEEMLYHGPFHTVFSAGNGEVEIYEMYVPAAWQGKTLSELMPGENCIPISVTRSGQAVIAGNETVIHGDDLLHVAATLEGAVKLRQRLDQKEA